MNERSFIVNHRSPSALSAAGRSLRSNVLVRCQLSRQRYWLLRELPDREDRAQNADCVDHDFQHVPAFFLRANQECVSSSVVHISAFVVRTPQSSPFV
jgi:hypothetical protein